MKKYPASLIPLLVCTIFLLPTTTLGETYTWTDEAGAEHFSDTPPPEQKGKKRRNVKRMESDVSSKWTKQLRGHRLYEDDIISIVIVDEGANFVKFNVLYDLPRDMEEHLLNKSITIAVIPWDTSLPQGVPSYLTNSIYWPTQLSGSVELKAGTSAETPLPVTSKSMAVAVALDDKSTGRRSYLVWKVMPYTKKWRY